MNLLNVVSYLKQTLQIGKNRKNLINNFEIDSVRDADKTLVLRKNTLKEVEQFPILAFQETHSKKLHSTFSTLHYLSTH